MLVEDQTLSPEEARRASAAEVPHVASAALWGWAALGLIGAAVSAYAGTRLTGGGNAIRWWFHAPVPSGHEPAKIVFWAGVATLCGAWLGLGMTLKRSASLSPKSLWIVGAAWCLPFLLGPPLFSHDVYSYIAQGTLVHVGHSPYHEAPIALGHLGHRHVLDGVDPFWRKTTAPYGPLFLGVVSLIVGAAGSHLVVGAVLVRLFDLIGIAVLAVFAPRLARALGADPRRALWLAMLSPLVWLQLVSNAHNDALMVGLMVAGVTLAVERRPLIGIAVCAVAATVKVPAVAAIVFIVVAWARELPGRRDQLKVVAKATLVTVAAAAIVTAVTGLGLAWISTGLFSTPGRVRLAITPATAVGYTIAHALHGVGVPLNGKQFEATLSHITFAITGLLGLFLLYRTRWDNMVRRLGWLLLAIAIGGPAAWPWYFTWGLALLAACPGIQFSRVIPLAVVVSAFIVIPTGQLAIPLGSSPEMVVFYLLVLAAAVWYWVRRLPRRAAMLANP
jgi:alpha-1,6-mannosyltransferase